MIDRHRNIILIPKRAVRSSSFFDLENLSSILMFNNILNSSINGKCKMENDKFAASYTLRLEVIKTITTIGANSQRV